MKRILRCFGFIMLLVIALCISFLWTSLVSSSVIKMVASLLIQIPYVGSPYIEIFYFLASHVVALIIYLPIVIAAVYWARWFPVGEVYMYDKSESIYDAIMLYILFALAIAAVLAEMETWGTYGN